MTATIDISRPPVSFHFRVLASDTIRETEHKKIHASECIFCGPGTVSDLLIRENGFDGRQCRGCGLIFVSPRPSPDEIIDLYGHDEAHVSSSSHLAASYSKRLYAGHTLDILCNHKASGDILDVGAGGGFFLDEARQRGFTPHAIEFNGAQIQHIRDVLQIPCVAKPLSEDPFAGKSFDVVYHCDVISHFYNPVAEFGTFYRALKDNGLLVFETGNLGDVDHRYLRLFDRFQYPDHLFFFSSDNIHALLASTGFELVAVYRYSILADLWTSRGRAKVRKFARRLTSMKRKVPPSTFTSSGMNQTVKGNRRSPLDLVKRIDQYVNYLIRYKLGRYLPKGRRPQTMIVVARKSGGSSA